MSEEMKVEIRDVEFIASYYLCKDLPETWDDILSGDDEEDIAGFYGWVERNAWEPYEHWEGEKLWDHIQNTAFDMIRYMKHRD